MVPLILSLLLLLPISAQAATYYVSTTGSDANDGLTESTPKRTIAHCVSIMVAGDTCLVRGGTYNESVVRFQTSGTSTAPITLKNYPGEAPLIDFVTRASTRRIFIEPPSLPGAVGWLIIEGMSTTNGWEGIKWTNLHNSIIRKNKFYNNESNGILGHGGHDNLIEKNIFSHNGNFSVCEGVGTTACGQRHGLYLYGQRYTILNNIIYDNIGVGIQPNGYTTSNYSSTKHPSTDFAGAADWIVNGNTVAYEHNGGGAAIWGANADNGRYENNIFYENWVAGSTSFTNGITCTGTTMTGNQIRNNLFYATGSGGLGGISATACIEGSTHTQSGNLTNTSSPNFVNGGSNSLPASPDWTLQSTSGAIGLARSNEFPNNATLAVGAFRTVGTPTASITTNKITLDFPMSAAVPIKNLSTTGVTVACTGSACPGGPTVSAVAKVVNTDSRVEVTVAGITGDACESANQTWTISYNASTGSWTGNDDIGPYPGLNQKIFSFTNLAVTNQCTGSGPSGYPAGYYLHYKFDEGTGTSANDESANNLDGTLTNGPTWGAGKTGSGVVLAGNNTQHVAIPYGSGVNPSTQSLTIAFGVNIPAGNETLSRDYFGAPLGTNQRLYISTVGSTWRLGIQSSNNTTAGDIAVTSGWHNVCLTMNSGTDTATLYIDGVASASAGAVKSYTSYTLSGDFDLGRIADIATGGGGGTYDDLLIYQSVEDCAAIASAFNTAPAAAAGTLAQAAIQFQGVVLDTAGSPITIGPAVQSIEVPAGGGVVLLFQVHCTNVSDCDPTSFKLVYSKNGSATWQQVPDIETADGTFMWGSSTDAHMNTGIRTTRLTGSCTVTNGTTQATSSQIPSIDLPQDGCTVLAYVVKEGTTQAGNYFDYKLRTEADVDFPVYTQTARVRVVNPMASGIGF